MPRAARAFRRRPAAHWIRGQTPIRSRCPCEIPPSTSAVSSTSQAERRGRAARLVAAVDGGDGAGGRRRMAPGRSTGWHPDALVVGVSAALARGLVDDLDWLAPAAAGVAPSTSWRRRCPWDPSSASWAGASSRGCSRPRRRPSWPSRGEWPAGRARVSRAPAIRARVALVDRAAHQPGRRRRTSGAGARVAARPRARMDRARRPRGRSRRAGWRRASSSGRRSEAAKRAALGDDHSLRVFKSDAVAQAWERLLADRESLVWRHVAVARGLLAPWVPALARAVEDALAPTLSPTEWRRAADLAWRRTWRSRPTWRWPSRGGRCRKACSSATRGAPRRSCGACRARPRRSPRRPRSCWTSSWSARTPEIGEAVVELRAELGDSPLAEHASKRALDRLGQPWPGLG